MKKLFSLLVCLVCAAMLATTSFAAETPSAYSIYLKAVSTLDSAKSIELSGTVKTILTLDKNEIVNTTEKSSIKVLNNTIALQKTDTDTNGTVSTYYKDGYLYESLTGIKTKTKYSYDIALSYIGLLDTNMSKEYFKKATVEQTDKGTVIKFKVSFEDLPSSTSYSLLVGPDNKLKSYTETFNFTSNSDGTVLKTKITTTYKIVSVDKVSKIDFPTDLKSYKLKK